MKRGDEEKLKHFGARGPIERYEKKKGEKMIKSIKPFERELSLLERNAAKLIDISRGMISRRISVVRSSNVENAEFDDEERGSFRK